jgi:hypothetical protein
MVRYDSKRDWTDHWTFPGQGTPKGTLEITEDGWVRPVYIAKHINACLNAPQFVTAWDREGRPIQWGGITGAGSNFSSAKKILDGDTNTSWVPDRNDDPKSWWVEIDLGRMVTATKIIVRFDPQGKPFEQFALYASNGSDAFYPGSGVKNYKLVGRTTQPNRAYLLEYPLEKEVIRGEEVERQMVRYIYMALTAWAEDPGQLAELEVYALGDNVMLGTLNRGGNIVAGEFAGQFDPKAPLVADGDYNTPWNAQTVIYAWRVKGWLRADLGSLFWLDTIRIMGEFARGISPLLGYKLFVSDGTLAPGATEDPVMGNFVWQEVASLEKNPPEGEDQSRYVFEEPFSSRPVRHIFFSHRNNERDRGTGVRVEILEIQAFGEGYVPKTSLASKLIDLGRSKNLTSVEWKADTPPGTRVEIRTRTGDRVEEIVHYYCKDGKECDKRKWDKEKSLFGSSGPMIVEHRPDAAWSGWSETYLHSGDHFASPSPRKYLLIEAALSSEANDVAPALDAITLFYTDPVAQELKGQIFPTEVQAGLLEAFSYFIQPSFATTYQGFDEILIRTPSQARLVELKVGDTTYFPQDLDSVYVAMDSLWVRLPVRVTSKVQPLFVQVQFRCEVFENNTRFEAFVADSRRRDSYQRVDPAGKGATTVVLPVTEKMIESVSITEIITPNGDGINDRASIEFTVLKVNQPRSIRVCIYTLRGETVAELEAEEERGKTGLSGRYRAAWDGRDDSGDILFPGIYLCRIEVDAEVGKAAVTRTIAVAF